MVRTEASVETVVAVETVESVAAAVGSVVAEVVAENDFLFEVKASGKRSRRQRTASAGDFSCGDWLHAASGAGASSCWRRPSELSLADGGGERPWTAR